MVGKVAIRGFLVVLALALVGACSSAPQPCEPIGDPCAPPCPPGSTEWPDVCTPDSAQSMLTHILAMAEQAHASDEIEQGDFDLIVLHVPRCSAPGFIPLEEQTTACARLRVIYDLARTTVVLPPQLPPPPPPEVVAAALRDASKRRWHTVATDLESFPAVPPPGNTGN